MEKEYKVYYEGFISTEAKSEIEAQDKIYDDLKEKNIGLFSITEVREEE